MSTIRIRGTHYLQKYDRPHGLIPGKASALENYSARRSATPAGCRSASVCILRIMKCPALYEEAPRIAWFRRPLHSTSPREVQSACTRHSAERQRCYVCDERDEALRSGPKLTVRSGSTLRTVHVFADAATVRARKIYDNCIFLSTLIPSRNHIPYHDSKIIITII